MTDLFNEWSSQTAVKIQPVTFTLDGITVDDTVIIEVPRSLRRAPFRRIFLKEMPLKRQKVICSVNFR